MSQVTLKGPYIQRMTDAEFFKFCLDNDEFLVERLSNKQIIMEAVRYVADAVCTSFIIGQIAKWNKENQVHGEMIRDKAFVLRNGAIRHSNGAWVSVQSISNISLTDRPQIKFCPDLIVDARKIHDDLKTSKAKMREWISNGCKLALLVDEHRKVIYRFTREGAKMIIGFDKTISLEPVLTGCDIDLSSIADESRIK